MNHADRQRLSQLLINIDSALNDPWAAVTDESIREPLAEARAIVDAPTSPDLVINIRNAKLDPKSVERLKELIAEGGPNLGRFSIGGINPGTETIRPDTHPGFFAQPVQEYPPIEAYGLRINRGNHRAGRTRLATVAALALASIALTAATATQSATPGPSHQPLPKPAANQPPRAGETRFPATHIPYLPGHTPGTPGNGLGVVTTP